MEKLEREKFDYLIPQFVLIAMFFFFSHLFFSFSSSFLLLLGFVLYESKSISCLDNLRYCCLNLIIRMSLYIGNITIMLHAKRTTVAFSVNYALLTFHSFFISIISMSNISFSFITLFKGHNNVNAYSSEFLLN